MPQTDPDAIYDTWDCWRERVSSTGFAMMPLAGVPPQRSIPIVLDGGSEYEVIMFVAGRRGAMPVIPAPTSQNTNRILLWGEQFGVFPIVDAGGINIYRVGGVYVFGILDPEGLLGDFKLGAAPMPNQPDATQEFLPANNIKPGMVNDGSPSLLQHTNASGEELRRQVTTQW
ncbi:MAG: hypothetical protein QOJ42_7663 [Acidobacteriaceae bacterium]|nr:hypothetical protein [Acidobacteriaceae bacterium]